MYSTRNDRSTFGRLTHSPRTPGGSSGPISIFQGNRICARYSDGSILRTCLQDSKPRFADRLLFRTPAQGKIAEHFDQEKNGVYAWRKRPECAFPLGRCGKIRRGHRCDVGAYASEVGAAVFRLSRAFEQLGCRKGRKARTPVSAPVEQIVTNLDEHHQGEELRKTCFFGPRIPAIVPCAVVPLTKGDCGQRRQGDPDHCLPIVGGFLPNSLTTRKPKPRPVPFGLAQVAEVAAVHRTRRFVGGKLLPEPAVAAFAELMLVEVVVDQCAQVEQAAQGRALFSPQPLPACSCNEIKRHDAKSSQRRRRPLPPIPKSTGCHASGDVEDGIHNHDY